MLDLVTRTSSYSEIPFIHSSLLDPVIHGFLTRFPYSLPCIVNFLLCLLAAILVAFFLPETLGMKQ